MPRGWLQDIPELKYTSEMIKIKGVGAGRIFQFRMFPILQVWLVSSKIERSQPAVSKQSNLQLYFDFPACIGWVKLVGMTGKAILSITAVFVTPKTLRIATERTSKAQNCILMFLCSGGWWFCVPNLFWDNCFYFSLQCHMISNFVKKKII